MLCKRKSHGTSLRHVGVIGVVLDGSDWKFSRQTISHLFANAANAGLEPVVASFARDANVDHLATAVIMDFASKDLPFDLERNRSWTEILIRMI